jgi:uracil-DNA glycosylase family 4
MDHQFKKIIQKTKDWNQGLEPLSKTFEGALFKDSAWPFYFNDSVINVVPLAPIPNPEVLSSSEKVDVFDMKDALSLVMFIGDTFIPSKGNDLLGKMIQAMKLQVGEFNRITFSEAFDDITDLSENLNNPSIETIELMDQIKKFKPLIVVSLGATITNVILGKREKLSSIHGEFFEKSIGLEGEEFKFKVMPIFHPDFLLINPNMKRTAWIDLQKVMERIGKI